MSPVVINSMISSVSVRIGLNDFDLQNVQTLGKGSVWKVFSETKELDYFVVLIFLKKKTCIKSIGCFYEGKKDRM